MRKLNLSNLQLINCFCWSQERTGVETEDVLNVSLRILSQK